MRVVGEVLRTCFSDELELKRLNQFMNESSMRECAQNVS